MSDRTPLYLDDLAVGQVYRSTKNVGPLTAEDIKTYARRFDPQPFHLDEEAAKASLFKGLAASGWHTASLTMSLLATDGAPIAGGVIGGGCDELRWPRPVRVGDSLRIESEVLDVRVSKSKPAQGVVRMRTTTLNQNDETVMVMTASLIVPVRPAA